MAESVSQTDRQLAEDTYAFCMEQMQEHFTVQFLASRSSVSPTKLKAVFRHVYGAPLFAYIRKAKLDWAACQLAKTNTKIMDIAESCGYDNASKFSAAFRAEFGVSPRDYRTKMSVRSRNNDMHVL